MQGLKEMDEALLAAFRIDTALQPCWSASVTDHANSAQAVTVQLFTEDQARLDAAIPDWRTKSRAQLHTEIKKLFGVTCGQHKIALLGAAIRAELAQLDSSGEFGAPLPATVQALDAASNRGQGSFIDRSLYVTYKWLSPKSDSEKGRGVDFAGYLAHISVPALDCMPEKGQRYDVKYRNAYGTFASLQHITMYIRQRFEQQCTLSKSEVALLAAVEDPYIRRMWCAMAIMGLELINPGHLMVKKAESALALAPHWDSMLAALARWTDNPEPLITASGRLLFPDLVDAQCERRAVRYECIDKWSAEDRCAAVATYAASDEHMPALLARLCGAAHAELNKLMPRSVEQLPASSRQALAVAPSSNDDLESTFGSLTEHIRRAPGGSTFHLTNKTIMQRNHTSQNVPDDVDFAGVRKVARELQAATPTKRQEDRDVQLERMRRDCEKAQAAADSSAKRQRRADDLAELNPRITTAAEVDALDWHQVLAQCRIRFSSPHPSLGKAGKPRIGNAGQQGDQARRTELRRVLQLEAALLPSSLV